MTIEGLMDICNRLPGVTTDIKWEHHLSFNVGEKIFLLTSPDVVPPNASFKVTEDQFDELLEREGIDQARHFARRQWVTINDISLLNKQEWEKLINNSFTLVASKLSAKKRRELGIMPGTGIG